MSRAELIEEAEKVAARHDSRCSPCVWWVCNWDGHEDVRRIIALYDALREARRALDAQEIVDLRAPLAAEKVHAEAAETDLAKARRERCAAEAALQAERAAHRATAIVLLDRNRLLRENAALRKVLEAAREVFHVKRPGYHDCIDDGLPECEWCLLHKALNTLAELDTGEGG